MYKFFIVMFLLLLTGCSDTPKKTVESVFEALEDGDLARLSYESSLKTSGYFSMYALKQCNLDLQTNKFKNKELEILDMCIKKAYADTRLEKVSIDMLSENEANAHVQIKSHNKYINHTWKVLKINDQWKLHVEGKETNPKSREVSFRSPSSD